MTKPNVWVFKSVSKYSFPKSAKNRFLGAIFVFWPFLQIYLGNN